MKLVVILPNLSMSRIGGRPIQKVSQNHYGTSYYCSKRLCQFLEQTFGRFHNGTGRGSLELAKGAKHKLRNHSKLTE